jgi:arsenate reductase
VYAYQVSHLIIVCEAANGKCPHSWPGLDILERQFWPFEDPAGAKGNYGAKLSKYRQVRDQIEQRIQSWLKDK